MWVNQKIAVCLNAKYAKMNDAKENLAVTAMQKSAHQFSYVKTARGTK